MSNEYNNPLPQIPLVSVVCITYNHEKYIKDAIESFLMQETTFPFEIIIHDDASTDGTAKIVKEYANKYPDIIVPILQKENQYSKKVGIKDSFISPLIRGDFVATCEGDDYWEDSQKLQKQVDFLINHGQYIACYHQVRVVDVNKNPIGRILGGFIKDSREIFIREAVVGGVLHVSSRVTRSSYYKMPNPPWARLAIHGDYANALLMAAEGRIFFLSEILSAYRSGVENSMMTNFKNNYSIKRDIEYCENRIKVLEEADQYYNYKYTKDISSVALISKAKISLLKRDFSYDSRKIYYQLIRDRGFVSFIKMIVLTYNEKLARLLIKAKYLVKPFSE